jgi:hypothetical protein
MKNAHCLLHRDGDPFVPGWRQPTAVDCLYPAHRHTGPGEFSLGVDDGECGFGGCAADLLLEAGIRLDGPKLGDMSVRYRPVRHRPDRDIAFEGQSPPWVQALLAALGETLAVHGGTAAILRDQAPAPLNSQPGVDAVVVSTDNTLT